MGIRRKEATKRLVELGRAGIPSDRLNAARKAVRDGDREKLNDIVAEVFELPKIAGALVRQGVDARIAERLTSSPSVNAVTNLFFTHMAVEWSALHGIETAKRLDRECQSFAARKMGQAISVRHRLASGVLKLSTR